LQINSWLCASIDAEAGRTPISKKKGKNANQQFAKFTQGVWFPILASNNVDIQQTHTYPAIALQI
jgi:hypothetical protein